MKQYLSFCKETACIKLKKDYILNINNIAGKISIVKAENKKNNSKKEILHGKHISFNSLFPEEVYNQLANIRHIGFEVTDSCNLKCTYCIYGDLYDNHIPRLNKKMDIKKAKMLIDFLVIKIKSSANKSILNRIAVSFYGGEPLLNMDFIKEMVSYTQRLNDEHIEFTYMVTTNAVYLKKYIEFLIEHDFSITVSLDGSKENNAYRKLKNNMPSYDIVYSNLKYIQEHHSNFFSQKIRFNTVMHNLNNSQEAFSFIYYNFRTVPHLSEINPAGINSYKKSFYKELVITKPFDRNETIENDMKEALGLDYGKLKQLQHFIFHYNGNIYDNYNELLIKRKDMRRLPTATCIPFSKRIFVTVSGKIYPCERIGHQFVLGEITDKEVKIDCEYIAQKYNAYYKSLEKQCIKCYYQKHCHQCIFDIQNLDTNPVCDQKATKQMLDEYIKNNMNILAKEPHLYKRIMTELITAN